MQWTSNAIANLLGRDTKRSLLLSGVIIALFILSYLGAILVDQSNWMPQGFSKAILSIAIVAVPLGVMAAANAVWNDGYVLSWLLVFAPVFGWLLSNAASQEGPLGVGQIFFSLGIAIFAATIVGTIGYTIGVGLTILSAGENGNVGSGPLLRVFLGDESRDPVRWGIRAGGIFLLTSFLIYITYPGFELSPNRFYFSDLFVPHFGLQDPIVASALVKVGWVALAILPAYRNEGLLISWVFSFGFFYGATLTDFVLNQLSGSVLLDATYALLLALVFSIIIGTAGYVLGRSLNRFTGNL